MLILVVKFCISLRKYGQNSDFAAMFEGVDLRHVKKYRKTVSDLSLDHLRLLNYRKEILKNNSAFTIHLHQNHARELPEGK